MVAAAEKGTVNVSEPLPENNSTTAQTGETRTAITSKTYQGLFVMSNNNNRKKTCKRVQKFQSCDTICGVIEDGGTL